MKPHFESNFSNVVRDGSRIPVKSDQKIKEISEKLTSFDNMNEKIRESVLVSETGKHLKED